MTPEQRELFDEAVIKLHAGRIPRRTFLERAMVAGLSASAASSFLEACGSTTRKNTLYLVWQSEYDISGAYQKITDGFNKANQDIHVSWQSGPFNTDLISNERDLLQARSNAFDIVSLDIITPAEFATKGYVIPITESQWPAQERKRYLQAPIKGCTFNGQLWAAPFRTDVGLMYYRKDIIATPPASWEELTSMARENKGRAKYGYIWQGVQNEALVCNFIEVLSGYGGSILDANNPSRVTLNSPEAVQALSEMVSWIGTISPVEVTTHLEEATRAIWERGEALFMRNWPYAYVSGNEDANSKVAGKFDIRSMLYGGTNRAGHSTEGGWQLAINAFITPERQQAAWKFIEYMLGAEAQKIGAMTASWAVTLSSIYDDAEVVKKVPLFKKLKPILQTAIPRPVTPNYSNVSNAIQLHVYQALQRKKSPRKAIEDLTDNLNVLVKTR
jgi:multiple sugar transport system substrate-binding protein